MRPSASTSARSGTCAAAVMTRRIVMTGGNRTRCMRQPLLSKTDACTAPVQWGLRLSAADRERLNSAALDDGNDRKHDPTGSVLDYHGHRIVLSWFAAISGEQVEGVIRPAVPVAGAHHP